MSQHIVETWLLHLESGEYPEAKDVPVEALRDIVDRHKRLSEENNYLRGVVRELWLALTNTSDAAKTASKNADVFIETHRELALRDDDSE